MKVLIPISSIYPSQEGGPSNSMYWLARALTIKGIEVEIIATDISLDKRVERNKWLHTNYGKLIFYSNISYTLPFKCIWATYQAIGRADIVHLNSIFYLYSFVAGLIALRKNKPIIWSVRGALDAKSLAYSKWKKDIYLPVFKWIFKKKVVFHVTAPQEEANTKIVLGSDIKVVTIPNYLILPQQLHLPKENYFSYIGRIHPIKAIERLIEAAGQNKMFMSSDFRLKIAGNNNNSYGLKLQKQVTGAGLRNKIIFVGHLEGEEKEHFLAASYCNFVPSHSENFGIVVIESLTQGTPVVVSKGSPWKILEESKAGFWVENSIESLSISMDKILSLDNISYQSYVKNAILLASQYDILSNIKVWKATYKQILTVN